MQKIVYLDHSATTPLDNRVLEKMLPYMTSDFGNANSLHSFGRRAIDAVDQSRDTVATLIGAKPNEIYFTSGGSEGDSWAIKSVAKCYRDKGNQIIITPIEHPALYSSAMDLVNEGFVVDFMKVDNEGKVDLEHLKSIVSQNTIFVGAMMANNEIGTIEPIKEIAKVAKSVGAISFTDAVQTTGSINYDVKDLGVDMLSMSAHKFYGPKGVGALYIKNGVKISPIIFGGHQERAKRGGTTNVAGVVGMATALRLALLEREDNALKTKTARDLFVSEVKKALPFVKINGAEDKLVSNASITFSGVSGEALLYNLDLNGVCASNGSACSTGSIEPSRTLIEIGLLNEDAKSTVRFSFGKDNTVEDALYAVKCVIECVNKIKK